MNDFKNEFNNLKKSLNKDNSSIVIFLLAGILIGRFYEKFSKTKKSILKKFK